MKVFSMTKVLIFAAVASMLVCVSVPMRGAVRQYAPTSIRGAIYVPSNAYNAPQMWKNFSAAETRRDFGYAHEVHLNALRIWASYEYWEMNPAKFQSEFDQMLDIAHGHGIRILISLFENDGVPPTEENMWTTDPHMAFAIQSPGGAIATGDPSGWEGPRRFVEWFMRRYGNDDRVLAVEVMNEPNNGKNGKPGTVPFAESMFKTARSLQGTVPLTIGSAQIKVAEEFIPLGLNIIEIHDNYPPSAQSLGERVKEALAVGRKAHVPVWLTEWQRTRPGGSGWGKGKVFADERTTDYASLAPTVYAQPIGCFFWSLMVKRAYLRDQQRKGTVNGLFWPDGAVTSVKDAQAIARDSSLHLHEQPIPADFGDAWSQSEAQNNGAADCLRFEQIM